MQMHKCSHVHMQAHMQTFIYMFSKYTYMHIHGYTPMYTHAYMRAFTHIHLHTYTYKHTYVCAYVHSAHTRMCAPARQPSLCKEHRAPQVSCSLRSAAPAVPQQPCTRPSLAPSVSLQHRPPARGSCARRGSPLAHDAPDASVLPAAAQPR